MVAIDALREKIAKQWLRKMRKAPLVSFLGLKHSTRIYSGRGGSKVIPCGGLFAVLGPLFGWVFYSLIAVLPGMSSMDGFLTSIFLLPVNLVAILVFAPLAYLFAFSVGFIPAVITGCIYGAYLGQYGASENPTALRRFLVGAGLGFCVTVAFAVLSGGKLHHQWIVFGFPGAFAGGFCALLITGKLYRWMFQNTCSHRKSD